MKPEANSPTRRRWTEEEDKTLLQLLALDLTNEEIGLTLGRSRHAVKKRLDRIRAAEEKDDFRNQLQEQAQVNIEQIEEDTKLSTTVWAIIIVTFFIMLVGATLWSM